MAVRQGLILYKIMTEHGAFMTMIRSAMLSKSRFNINGIIHQWWSVAFTKGLPNRTVGEVIVAIAYKLIMKGYEKQEITPSDKFLKNYHAAINFRESDFSETSRNLNRCENYLEYYKLTIDELNKLFPINLTEEARMAVKKSTEKTNTSKKADAGKTGTWLDKCKSPRLRLYIPLIIEQKMSDEEIIQFMHKKGYKEVNKMFVSCARKNLNSGVYKWAPKLEKELIEIREVEEEEPTRPAPKKQAAVKKTEKKPPVSKTAKKTAKKTPAKETPAKKTTAKKTAVKKTAKQSTKRKGKTTA